MKCCHCAVLMRAAVCAARHALHGAAYAMLPRDVVAAITARAYLLCYCCERNAYGARTLRYYYAVPEKVLQERWQVDVHWHSA